MVVPAVAVVTVVAIVVAALVVVVMTLNHRSFHHAEAFSAGACVKELAVAVTKVVTVVVVVVVGFSLGVTSVESLAFGFGAVANVS